MSDKKNNAVTGAENATGAAGAADHEMTQPAAESPVQAVESGDVGVYTHKFKRPFEYSGATYTELTFNFERLTGRDMVAIETEMQMNNEYALSPEISRNFQSKLAARAAGIGSDVLDAMPLPEFNRITNAARDFLLSTGY